MYMSKPLPHSRENVLNGLRMCKRECRPLKYLVLRPDIFYLEKTSTEGSYLEVCAIGEKIPLLKYVTRDKIWPD